MPIFVGDFPLMSLLQWACSVTIMMTSCYDVTYDIYKSPFTIRYKYLGTISSSFLAITHAYEMLDGDRSYIKDSVRTCKNMVSSLVQNSPTLAHSWSETGHCNHSMLWHSSLLCCQMSCPSLRLISSHTCAILVLNISSCVIHSWESLVINCPITTYSHSCTCNLYPPESVVI
jgi:hypothetical protein